MCMNHVCPSSSYVTTVKELQSYNDQASQEIECDMRYVNRCDLFLSQADCLLFVEVCEYPVSNLDRQLVCLECWMNIIYVCKYDGQV